MTTLIAAYNSDGCVGRCDAKCYNAVTEQCDCICGGLNHGVGKPIAMANTRKHYEDWMRETDAKNTTREQLWYEIQFGFPGLPF